MSEKIPAFEMLRKDSDMPDFEAHEVPDEVIGVFSEAAGRWLINDCHGFWLEPDSHDGHCNPDRVVYSLGMQMSQLCAAYDGCSFGSPIEAKLFAALLWVDVDWAGLPKTDSIGLFERFAGIAGDKSVEYWITSQAQIGDYKVDLLVWFSCGRHRAGIAIECDGHEFHEKTKEQAARDKKRDREILAAGFPVVRFTGSEIYRSPTQCAAQVTELLKDVLFRVSKDGGLI